MKLRQTAGLAAICAALLVSAPVGAETPQDPKPCPMHAEHMKKQDAHGDHHAGVDRRGDEVMGFSHETTRHHFLLTREGGRIEVVTTDERDTAGRDRIRGHLREVADAFAKGDFSMPRAIHDRVLPGVAVMTERKGSLRYSFEEIERGGRVRIRTRDAQALAAVHEFLRSQIEDHRTGDATDVQE
jgi:hypothetical protein